MWNFTDCHLICPQADSWPFLINIGDLVPNPKQTSAFYPFLPDGRPPSEWFQLPPPPPSLTNSFTGFIYPILNPLQHFLRMNFHSTSPPHKTSFPQTQEDHPSTSHLQGNSRWVAAHFTCFFSFSSFFLPSHKPPRDWPPWLLLCYKLPLTSISIFYPSDPYTSCFRPQPWPTNSCSDFAYQFIQQVDHSYSMVRSALLLLDSTKPEGTRSPHHKGGGLHLFFQENYCLNQWTFNKTLRRMILFLIPLLT